MLATLPYSPFIGAADDLRNEKESEGSYSVEDSSPQFLLASSTDSETETTDPDVRLNPQSSNATQVASGEVRGNTADRASKSVIQINRASYKEGYRVKTLQVWEGTVLELGDRTVWAEVYDLTNETNNVEYVELSLGDFNKYDKGSVEVGSSFYWGIGYKILDKGKIEKVSEIRVRRLPPLTRKQLGEIKQQTATFLEAFGTYEQIAPNGEGQSPGPR